MKFIRDNIVKIILVFGILVVVIIILIACSGSGGSGNIRSYSRIEDNFKNSATKFLQKNTSLLPTEEGKIVKVPMDTIYTEKQMKKIVSPEDSNIRCDGYVNVSFRVDEKEDKIYRVVPHIKCGDKYETEELYVHILKNEDIVTELDGLYKIGDTYYFRGENPNNYLQLGSNLYRILSIDSDGYIKLANADNLHFNSIWDDRYNVDTKKYTGINDYYVSRIRENILDFYNNDDYYSKDEKNVFVKRSYCIGKRSEKNVAINNTEECQETSDEDYVSLPTLFDYYIVSVDTNCKQIGDESCNNYNFLSDLGNSYTLTGSKEDTSYVYQNGDSTYISRLNSNKKVTIITFISNVSYSSGKGTLESPYIIK